MRNIAVTILALVALAFGWECDVGGDWCFQGSETYVIYGGPEKSIAKFLKDPCRGNPISRIAMQANYTVLANGEDAYIIDCETERSTDVKLILISPTCIRAWSEKSERLAVSPYSPGPDFTQPNTKAFKVLQTFDKYVRKKSEPWIKSMEERKIKDSMKNIKNFNWNP